MQRLQKEYPLSKPLLKPLSNHLMALHLLNLTAEDIEGAIFQPAASSAV